jgi:hypothetical protein
MTNIANHWMTSKNVQADTITILQDTHFIAKSELQYLSWSLVLIWVNMNFNNEKHQKIWK